MISICTQLYLKTLILTMVMLAGAIQVEAQTQGTASSKSARTSAGDAIEQLHQHGWLVVRLPGYRKKIATLDSLIQRVSSTRAARNLKNELDRTLIRKSIFHTEYPMQFKTKYGFSKVAFIEDYETIPFLSGDIRGRDANNQNLSQSITGESLFFVDIGARAGAKGDAFMISDRNLKVLPYPFPNNIQDGSVPIIGFFLELFENENDRIAQQVERLDRLLRRFYAKNNL